MKNIIQTLLLVTLLLGGAAWAGKVDINKADAAALQENLQGIGPVKAKAIVDYRKKNGSFKTYDDLMKVPGIGEETIKKNKANLSLKGGITKASAKKSSDKASSAKASVDKKAKESKSKSEKAKKATKDNADKAKKSAKDSAKSKADKAKKEAKEKAKSATK